MIPGKTQLLKIAEKNYSGLFLEDENGERAFLPKIFASESAEIGDEMEVFVYQDDDKLKATTEKPFAETGEFAIMTCVQSLPSGAFMDWGIIKDLFVPYKQQKQKIIEGKKYLVYVYLDEILNLITGSTRFKRNPQYEDIPFRKGDKVNLILMGEGELGWNVVINKEYIGLIYSSDVYKKLDRETGEFWGLGSSISAKFVWRASAINGRHIWGDKYLSNDIFCSDEFMAELDRQEIRAFNRVKSYVATEH